MTENKICSNCEYCNDEEYIQALEKENQMLKEKIVGISALLYRMNEYMEDMDLIIKWRNNNE